MKALATFADGNQSRLLELSLPSFRRYAKLYGYEPVVADTDNLRRIAGDSFYRDSDRPASWLKLPLFDRLLDRYTEVLWLDADVVITSFSRDIAQDIPEPCLQALACHPNQFGDFPNCGVWFIRSGMREHLRRMWRCSEYRDSGLWENAAMMKLLGMPVEYQPVGRSLAGMNELFRKTCWLPDEWNACPGLPNWPVQNVRFKHAAGDPDSKLKWLKQWAEEEITDEGV